MTFVPYTRRIYGRTLRVISGFGSFGPLAPMRTPHALPKRGDDGGLKSRTILGAQKYSADSAHAVALLRARR